MDEDGPFARRGNLELADEARALHVVRGALVIVVEADFAAGDDFRLGQEGVEFGQGIFIGFCGAVRIDPRACEEPGKVGPAIELAAKVERLVHFGRPLANSDGKHEANARLPRADKHRFAIVRVPRAVKVGVGVDQQFFLVCRVGKCIGNRPV